MDREYAMHRSEAQFCYDEATRLLELATECIDQSGYDCRIKSSREHSGAPVDHACTRAFAAIHGSTLLSR